jgi:hypothetical protein
MTDLVSQLKNKKSSDETFSKKNCCTRQWGNGFKDRLSFCRHWRAGSVADIVPKDVDAGAPAIQKNKLVNDALQAAINQILPRLYKRCCKAYHYRQFDDNMKDIAVATG